MIDRYSRKELRALWSDQRRYDTWLDVELAACAAMEREGSVPEGTADRVRERAAGRLNPARILEIEERTRHDVIAFLTHVEELAGADARRLHLGMTSSDGVDTSFPLLLTRAVGEIAGGLGPPAAALPPRAEAHPRRPTIGRPN